MNIKHLIIVLLLIFLFLLFMLGKENDTSNKKTDKSISQKTETPAKTEQREEARTEEKSIPVKTESKKTGSQHISGYASGNIKDQHVSGRPTPGQKPAGSHISGY